MDEYFDYMIDSLYKHLMRSNKEFLCHIISYVIKDISYEEALSGKIDVPELNLNSIKEKGKITDILYKIGNTYIDIEMNKSYYANYMNKNLGYIRALYLYYQKKDEETKNNRYIQINLDNFSNYGKNIINEYPRYNKENNIIHNDKCEIYHVNLEKIRKIEYTKSVDKGIRCLKVLAATNEEELFYAIGKDKYLKGVKDKMEEFIKLYRPGIHTEEELERHYRESLEVERSVGFENGKEIGKEQANINTAKKMLKDNIPIEFVSKYTNLSVSKLKNIQL